jgi:DNA polymerase phi
LLAAFTKAMTKAFKYLQETLRPDQQLWVRSTPYGHAKCSQYTVPSKSIITPTGQEGEYEWDMFEAFDLVWKVSFQSE